MRVQYGGDSPERWSSLLLVVAVVFGGIVRFAPAALAGWPVNDGGMFYAMIQELRANHFLLPAFTSYNHLNIPFAYPPLSLYAGAALSALGVRTIDVVRWFPAFVSTLSILAFYWMAAQMLGSKSRAAVGAAVYALMPRSFSWYVMGGGLSRSSGILFLLLTCGAAWQLFDKPSRRHLLLTIACGAGAVLSHPETALHTVTACMLIGLFQGRNRRGARDAILVAVGVAAITSPWWAVVLAQHGGAPFQSALYTGAHGGFFLLSWLTFNFAQEPFLGILTALGLLGLAVQVVGRRWFLPVWTLLPFVIEPRSAPAIAALPLAALAAIGMADFLLPRLASLKSQVAAEVQDWADYLNFSGTARAAMGFVLLYALFAAFAYDLSLAGVVVPARSRAAMQWVVENTPRDAQFVVLTGASDPFADAGAEWFPALTGRTSVNTLQGREWLLGSGFMPFLASLNDLEACVDIGLKCVDQWAREHSNGYDYIYLQREAGQAAADQGMLASQLKEDLSYQLVYDTEGVAIFARR